MCGIFGFSRRTKITERMIPILAAAMELRGDDSWGVTDGEKIYKYPSSILSSYEDHKCDTPTYHTRGASIGNISQRNAHPFEYISYERGITVIGVHNGHISNHDELKKQHLPQRKDFEVDSENIFAQLAENLPTKDVRGWGAVVWYEFPTGKPKQRRRYITTFNNNAMHIAKLSSGEMVFASTIESIRIAARFAGVTILGVTKIVDKMKYELMPQGELRSCGLMEWDAPPPFAERSTSEIVRDFHNGRRISASNTSSTGSLPSLAGNSSTCKGRTCHRMCNEEQVLCDSCIRLLMQTYLEWNTDDEESTALVEAIVDRDRAIRQPTVHVIEMPAAATQEEVGLKAAIDAAKPPPVPLTPPIVINVPIPQKVWK